MVFMPSLLLHADSDSQVFASRDVAHKFKEQGWRVVFNIPIPGDIPVNLLNSISEQYDIQFVSAENLGNDETTYNFDAIGVLASGSRIASIRRDINVHMQQIDQPRPILFTGFNGLVYEKFEEGLAWRLGYDCIALNGPRDERQFLAFVRDTPFAAQPYVLTGLGKRGYAPSLQTAQAPVPSHKRKMLIFAEQVTVPVRKRERRWLFEQLARLAQNNPDWDIVVRPRVFKSEKTFHKQILPPENVFFDRVPNIRIDHTALGTLLTQADLLLTVSSTAIFDAMARGVTPLIVADFGVRNDLGTHVFWSSGLRIALSEDPDLNDIVGTAPDTSWLEDIGATSACTQDTLVRFVESRRQAFIDSHADNGNDGVPDFPPNPYDNMEILPAGYKFQCPVRQKWVSKLRKRLFGFLQRT